MVKGTILYPKTMNYHEFHQRPQSLLMQFARHGWRVIWENLTERAILPERIAKNFWVYHNKDDLQEDFDSFDIIFAHWAKHYNPKIPYNLLLHDCTDYFESWQKWEKRISKTADIVTCVSEPLRRYFKNEFNRNATVISNGVDYKHLNSNKRMPPEFKHFKRPIIGFIGAIGHWSDISVFQTISEQFTTVCIGLYANIMKRPRGMEYLTHQLWERMPEFYNNIDVGIIPTTDHPTAVHAVPLKAWEYLACGKPVVATENEQLEKDLGDVVTTLPVAKTRTDRRQWITTIKRELKKDNAREKQKRMERMEKETWDKRYHQFEVLIEEKL